MQTRPGGARAPRRERGTGRVEDEARQRRQHARADEIGDRRERVRSEDVADLAQRGLRVRPLPASSPTSSSTRTLARRRRQSQHQRAAHGALHFEEDPGVVGARAALRRSRRCPCARTEPTCGSVARPAARAPSRRDPRRRWPARRAGPAPLRRRGMRVLHAEAPRATGSGRAGRRAARRRAP